jgi:hypothetical protein
MLVLDVKYTIYAIKIIPLAFLYNLHDVFGVCAVYNGILCYVTLDYVLSLSCFAAYPISVEPLITDTDGEFQFCPLKGVSVSWGSSSDYPVRLKGHPWLPFSTSLACRAAIRAPVLVIIAVANYFG